jgi:hypothetical protein
MDVCDLENDWLYHVIRQSDTKAFSYMDHGPDQDILLFSDIDIRRYSYILPELTESSTIISQTKMNGEIFALHSGSELDHDENNLEIILSVLSYRNPEQNKYEAFLDGFNKEVIGYHQTRQSDPTLLRCLLFQ